MRIQAFMHKGSIMKCVVLGLSVEGDVTSCMSLDARDLSMLVCSWLSPW